MWFPTLAALRRARSGHRAVRRKAVPTRLALEALEDRSVPSFLAPVTSPAGGDSVAVGDFNQDRRDDVVVITGTKSVGVSLSRGDGTFFQSSNLTGALGPLLSVGARDVDGDGHLDVVAIGYSRKYETICNVSMGWCVARGTEYDNVWLGKGNGSFGRVSNTSTLVTFSVWPSVVYNPTATTADFNHDGVNDLAGLDNATGMVAVNLGNADGTYQPAQTYDAGKSPRSIMRGDFNGDGWTDLVVVNSLSSGQPTLSVLLNDGNW